MTCANKRTDQYGGLNCRSQESALKNSHERELWFLDSRALELRSLHGLVVFEPYRTFGHAGEVLAEFDIPTPSSGPRCISAMSNGRLYFTQYDASMIGEILFD